MKRILSTVEMKNRENEAILAGISTKTLIFRAGQALFASANFKGKNTVIFCGGGNNGADGWALASILEEKGFEYCCFMLKTPAEDAKEFFDKVPKEKIIRANYPEGIMPLMAYCFAGYDIIVDCIFGTGLSKDISGFIAYLVSCINESGSFVLSADIPSGLASESGQVRGIAVKATKTIAIDSLKFGHFLGDGKDFCGEIFVADIGLGIPQGEIFDEKKLNIFAVTGGGNLSGRTDICEESSSVKCQKSAIDDENLTVARGSEKCCDAKNNSRNNLENQNNLFGGMAKSQFESINEENYAKLFTAVDLAELYPKRKNNCHKGNFGKLAVIGGSENYAGAVVLSAIGQSALRSGAGLCKICTPIELSKTLGHYNINTTLEKLLANDKGGIAFEEQSILSAIEGFDCVAFGMGVGREKELCDVTNLLICNCKKLLIDADGLFALAKNPKVLSRKVGEIILTPHPLEFARLLGVTVEEVLANPIELSKEFSRKYDVTVVLKGVSTIVAGGGKVAVISVGLPSMAKGGTGDILSGIISGLFASRESFEASVAGCLLLGKAYSLLEEKREEYSILASDLIGIKI